MLPVIARNLFRLQEKILGRDSFRILNELKESQYWPVEKIEELRCKRFKEVVKSAYENTKYWKNLIDSAGINPYDIKNLEDLKRFPLLEKDTLRKNREDMVWKNQGKRVQLVRTSGSTNEALEFYTSSEREAHINAARMRGHEWAGVKRGEKEMYYWGSPVELSKQDRLKRFRDFLINDGLTNGFELSPEKLKDYYKKWLNWKPVSLFGYPSTFVLTINMCSSLGIDLSKLKKKGLRVIVTTSEMLSETDRDLIKKAFQVPVHDSYGLREGGLIGYECEKGVMHSMDEQLILETIDPQTLEPCEKEGELVLTNVTGTAFPVIRYRTGDIVTLSKKKCECGKTLSSLKVSGGRAVEFVVAKDGRWIVGYSFIYIARSVKGIVKFQIIQEKIGAILIRITVDDNFPEDGKAQVEAAAAARLKSGDKIFVEIVEDIKPAPSGKYRPVISKPAEDLIKQRVFT